MLEDIDDSLARLRKLSDGTYEAQPSPTIDVNEEALFAALSRATLEGPECELLPGLRLRPTYAHVFAPSMLAVASPSRPSSPHPSPWYALQNDHAAETAQIQVSLAAGARPLDMPRFAILKLVAAAIRLVSSQPVCLPILANVPFEEARQPSGPVHVWRFEQPLAISGQPITLTPSFNEALARFLSDLTAIRSDPDLERAFILADGLWWLPTPEAQLITIWTVIEMLMRPGRRETTKSLARAVRAYVGRDRASGDRLYQDVARLYLARGSSVHAGLGATMHDVRESYMILREILLRAFLARQRPPRPEDITPLW